MQISNEIESLLFIISYHSHPFQALPQTSSRIVNTFLLIRLGHFNARMASDDHIPRHCLPILALSSCCRLACTPISMQISKSIVSVLPAKSLLIYLLNANPSEIFFLKVHYPAGLFLTKSSLLVWINFFSFQHESKNLGILSWWKSCHTKNPPISCAHLAAPGPVFCMSKPMRPRSNKKVGLAYYFGAGARWEGVRNSEIRAKTT